MKRIIITGGLGFIGSEAVRYSIKNGYKVLNIDAVKYSGNFSNVEKVSSHKNYNFVKVDLLEKNRLENIINDFRPDAILHFAAESHVDNSIKSPFEFMKSNIEGTFNLLEASKNYYLSKKLNHKNFHFIHISTDEVFGSLGKTGMFTESTSYNPQSPYSASKASSDHLVRAWHNTYDLPVKITNCSNNYGPFQHSEKFVPVVIKNALDNRNIPIYGSGENIRDWLYVSDHVEAIFSVLFKGRIGETYLIGGNNELSNIDLATVICNIVDKTYHADKKRIELIELVQDRKGHDFRYAIDSTKIKNETGWEPKINFEEGIAMTVEWFIKNRNFQ